VTAWRLAVVLVALMCAWPAARSSAGREQARLAPGDAEIALTHDGRRRSYLVHVPPGAGSSPLPLVIAFHGGGGNASGFKAYAGLDRVADRERFVVVYPNGTGPLRRVLLTFNAGNNCCGPALAEKIDDVGFAGAVLEDLARRVPIDRRRISTTGHSNGAMMAYRLAAERADLVAAVVAVAGAMSLDGFAPSRPVPVLHIHSVDDPRALYGGGVGPPFPGTDSRVTHAPVQAALDRWVARNGCEPTPTVAETREGRTGTADGGQTATRLVYGPCRTGAPVEHWRLTGAGHGWPGAGATGRERLAGPATSIVDAAEEIWRFAASASRQP
jgi:polyhydroxybutyrate depolymerase